MSANGNDSKVKGLKDFIKDETAKKGVEFISQTFDSIVEAAKKRFKILKECSNDSIVQLIKMAWNYEEKFQESYGLEDAIRWFKDNHPGKKYLACILMQKKVELKELPTVTSLHHCFIEITTNNPILDGSLPYRIIQTIDVKDDLKKAFGNKDMIILK